VVRVDLGLHDAASRALRWQVVEQGPVADLTSTVGRATVDLRRQLGLAADEPERSSARQAALPTSQRALRAYSEGLEAMRASDYATAGRRLTAALAEAPTSPAVLLAMAEVHDMDGQYQRRQEALARALELSRHASREEQLSIEARYRQAMGETAKAVELYSALSHFFPDNPQYGYQLVWAELALGAPRDGLAIVDHLRGHTGRADDPWLDLLEGELRRELGDLDGA
jgi:predicted Zn-dependent protease